jgi:ATP-dependent Clp protease ATP-binding subunit ClpA
LDRAVFGTAEWRGIASAQDTQPRVRQGRAVDFKNTVIMMTSNIRSRHLIEGVSEDTIPDVVREAQTLI